MEESLDDLGPVYDDESPPLDQAKASPKHLYAKARPHAEALLADFAPHCERIEIAGSLRRLELEVSDIELVAVPRAHHDLFGEPSLEGPTDLDMLIHRLIVDRRLEPRVHMVEGRRRQRMGRRFKALRLVGPGIPVDLFLCLPPAQWGALLAIRTGPAAFSKRLVTQCQEQPRSLRCAGGRLVDMLGADVPTPTEADFFQACGVPFVAPDRRG